MRKYVRKIAVCRDRGMSRSLAYYYRKKLVSFKMESNYIALNDLLPTPGPEIGT